jgi:hypothetical protein
MEDCGRVRHSICCEGRCVPSLMASLIAVRPSGLPEINHFTHLLGS